MDDPKNISISCVQTIYLKIVGLIVLPSSLRQKFHHIIAQLLSYEISLDFLF